MTARRWTARWPAWVYLTKDEKHHSISSEGPGLAAPALSSCPYSPEECVEGEFCELRLEGVLGSLHRAGRMPSESNAPGVQPARFVTDSLGPSSVSLFKISYWFPS